MLALELGVGVRFDDRTSSSWIPGYSFTIPPTRLIHVDIDPEEIGRNYPVALGLMADVRTFLQQIHAETARKVVTLIDMQQLAQRSEKKGLQPLVSLLRVLKRISPEQAKTLTREERLEVFRSSLAAMGLTEDGPMTPDQKKLVDRMYRSMVLDEIRTPPNQ